ncbi:hypothetical protein C8R48DRAFT_780245 [Suillus tomentosus]|nr:hypothetical protein C8R48DRAFT_780245 [Suillus tomentosus]
MADPYNCGWQDATAPEDDIMPGDPADDPYDCGWEDPMEGPTTMRLSVDKTFYMDTDVIDLTSESPSRSVDRIFDERDVIDLTSESPSRSIDRTFDEETDVLDLTSTSVNRSVDRTFGKETNALVLTSTSANSERSMSPTEPNAFQEAGESMRRAIRRLNSIGHSDYMFATLSHQGMDLYMTHDQDSLSWPTGICLVHMPRQEIG